MDEIMKTVQNKIEGEMKAMVFLHDVMVWAHKEEKHKFKSNRILRKR